MRIRRGFMGENKQAVRLDNVDLIRAMAVVAVMVYHYTTRFPPSFLFAETMPVYFPYGKYGVDVFFSVSGFCIYMTLGRSASFSHFAAMRFSRIQPAYMASVVLTFVFVAVVGLPGREVSFVQMLGNLIWLNALPGWPMVDGAYWSLIVELKFYAALGILFFLIRGRYLAFYWSLLCGASTVVALAAQVMPVLAPARHAVDFLFVYPFTPIFLVGLIAWECRSGWNRRLVIASVICVFSLAISERFTEFAGLGLVIGGLAFALLKAEFIRIPAWVSYLGLISYALYLVHQNIGLGVIRILAPFVKPIEPRIAIASAVVILLAILIHKTVELRWRRQVTKVVQKVLGLVTDRVPVLNPR